MRSPLVALVVPCGCGDSMAGIDAGTSDAATGDALLGDAPTNDAGTGDAMPHDVGFGAPPGEATEVTISLRASLTPNGLIAGERYGLTAPTASLGTGAVFLHGSFGAVP